MFEETLALVTALLWAGSTVALRDPLKEIDPLSVNALKTLFAALSMLPIFFIAGEINSQLDIYGLFLVTIAAILGFGLGDTLFLRSISLIGVSKSYTIAYTFPFFTMLLGILMLGEPFLMNHLIGITFIFLAIIFVASEKSNKAQIRSKGVILALTTSIIWSIAMTIAAFGLATISTISANTVRYPFLLLVLIFLSRPWTRKCQISRRNLILLAISGTLGMAIGGITFLFSIQLIGVSKATALGASSPFWASIMSALWLKEKVTWRIMLAAILVVFGICFLV
ncbi:MAG: DMT family transporter [Candidatus Bathyarchaeia archaeon]